MKRIVYLLFACALLYACKSDDPTFCTCKITETQVTSLVYNEAKIHYMIEHPSLNGNGDSYKSPSIAKYGVYYSATNNNPTSNDQVVLYDHSGDYSMSEEVTITGLKEKTHYYVRGVLRDALGSQILGDVIEFTTPRIPDDKVTMNFTGITEITKTTANFQGSITIGQDRKGDISECGYICSPYSSPSFSDANYRYLYWSNLSSWAGTHTLNGTIDGLNANTHYYVRMYYKIGSSYYYGAQIKDFTTIAPDDKIVLNFKGFTEVTANSFRLNGSVTIGADVVGVATEVGYVFSDANSVPTYNNSSSMYTGDIVTWSAGERQMNWETKVIKSGKTYYARMYYKIGETFYYDTNIKTCTTPSTTEMTVDQLVTYYNSLNLEVGKTAFGYFSVRGYVTAWTNGYPTYQNADFYMDSSSSGTNRVHCFRLVGIKTSDQRTLKVGDYVEAKDCQLMNYNGQLELKNGNFTIISSAQ